MPDKSDSEPAPTPPESVPLRMRAANKTGALDPHDSVATAGDRMREHDAATWPVAEDRKLVGMVDEKNPDWRIGGQGHDPKVWQVGQIMSREVFFCFEDEDAAHARKVMQERDLRYLPVVDRQMRIVGIFSREEIEETAENALAAEAKPKGAEPPQSTPETP